MDHPEAHISLPRRFHGVFPAAMVPIRRPRPARQDTMQLDLFFLTLSLSASRTVLDRRRLRWLGGVEDAQERMPAEQVCDALGV
jgi:hypothetical protein